MDRRVIILAIAILTPFGFASGGEEECDNFVAQSPPLTTGTSISIT
jgi:hypothetical protein